MSSLPSDKQLQEIDPFYFRNVNPNNRLITKQHIEKIFKKFGINEEINDIRNYQVAFVHKSYVRPDSPDPEDEVTITDSDNIDSITKEEYIDNVLSANPSLEGFQDPEIRNKWVDLQSTPYEIMELLGDSIIGNIVIDYLIERYPGQQEGYLTKFKTQLVRGTSLCILAKRLKFDKYVLISRKEESKGSRQNEAILEDVLEAFIGAVYVDFGKHAKAFGICKDLFVRLMERYMNLNLFARRKNNYKDLLLQYFHKNFSGENPKYRQVSFYGPTNNRIFKAGVINTDGHMITTGEGTKLVEAEQEAAKEALKYYGLEVYSDSEDPDLKLYYESDDLESE
tara:strand:+ start:374 stop:1387 length:1014 start_codon:yes stop_codon:yes gene_type:complete